MKTARNYDFLLGLFFLFFHQSLAQRGYSYGRPGLLRGSATNTAGNPNVGNLPTSPISNSIRPILGAVPTGTGSAVGFPTAPTAFGAPSSVPSTAPFGAFPGQSQRGAIGIPSTAAAAAIGSNFATGTTSGLQSRPSATQRPGAGLFGSTVGRGQSTQFSDGTATGTGSGADIDYDGNGDFSAIPGIPAVDYPIYSQVPQTNFDCAQQALPGYYSDVEAQCQVFHICALNRTYSFLCPNGTVFSQETLVCVWWNQYDCSSAPSLYANNAFIYDYSKQDSVTNTDNYQSNGVQVGISGAARTQSNYQIAGRGTTVTQPTSIFGSAVGIRPTITSGGYGGVTTPLTPAPTFAGGNIGTQMSIGRFQQTAVLPTTSSQVFPDASTGLAKTPIGSIVQGEAETTSVVGDRISAQQNTLQTAQLSTSSTNREYLPPARRS